MTENVWQSIATIPWWVFLLTAYIINESYSATKPRLVPIRQLYITPIFFVGLATMYMCAQLQMISLSHFAIWTSALLLGTGLGYLQFQIFKIKIAQNNHSIYLAGSWMPLITLSILCAIKFYFHYPIKINTAFFLGPKHAVLILFLYGSLAGLFLGRLGYALREQRVNMSGHALS